MTGWLTKIPAALIETHADYDPEAEYTKSRPNNKWARNPLTDPTSRFKTWTIHIFSQVWLIEYMIERMIDWVFDP